MEPTIIISTIALVISLIALFYRQKQISKQTEAISLQNQISIGNSIEHFTSRFFTLLEKGKGDIQDSLKDDTWAYQFWSLLSTEFYFFHHGTLPKFMFSLWMIDLAKIYEGSKGEKIRKSHNNYLDKYSFLYEDMTIFFNKIQNIAIKDGHEISKNKEIAKFIDEWIEKNKKETFQ